MNMMSGKGRQHSASMQSSGVVVPVSVVEGHDEALPVIYRAIGGKRLPFSGTVLLHFDAHPDLLCPSIPADEMCDTEKLFALTEIADWLLPTVFMGHVGAVYWLKPPWATQMPEGSHDLCVGRDRTSGLLRVGTPLPYFITELLYQPKDQLEDTHSIPLHVVTLHPPDPPSSTTGDRSTIPPSLNEPPPPESSSPDGVKRCKLNSTPPHALVAAGGVASRDSVTGSAMAAEEVMRRHPAWILDIDLDFFSTGNPFKAIFTEGQFECLTRLYRLEEPVKPGCKEAVEECVRKRERQLEQLQALWVTDDDVAASQRAMASLSSQDRKEVLEIREMIGSYHEGMEIEAKDVHEYGIMTDLPVHHSSPSEVAALVAAMTSWLAALSCPPPALVTIARSTEDEYTPRSQVEDIQEEILTALEALYRHVDVELLYLKTRVPDPEYDINFPLYLRTVDPLNETDLQFQYIVHTSIDVIEEKISMLSAPKVGNDPREHYLGMLYPSEQHKVYGYATNTRVKFVIVTDNTTSQNRDADMKLLFKNLHVAYTDMFCNPFYATGTKITSKAFDETVMSIFQTSKIFVTKE